MISFKISMLCDHLCGLVVRVPGYRSRDLGSIHGASRFSEKWWVRNRLHSALSVELRSYLRTSNDSCLENRDYGRRDFRRADHTASPLSVKVSINFTDKLWSFSRYSSLADSGHGVSYLLCPSRFMPSA
jgi:hypothetical protein